MVYAKDAKICLFTLIVKLIVLFSITFSVPVFSLRPLRLKRNMQVKMFFSATLSLRALVANSIHRCYCHKDTKCTKDHKDFLYKFLGRAF